jgi:hypothetical protein
VNTRGGAADSDGDAAIASANESVIEQASAGGVGAGSGYRDGAVSANASANEDDDDGEASDCAPCALHACSRRQPALVRGRLPTQKQRATQESWAPLLAAQQVVLPLLQQALPQLRPSVCYAGARENASASDCGSHGDDDDLEVASVSQNANASGNAIVSANDGCDGAANVSASESDASLTPQHPQRPQRPAPCRATSAKEEAAASRGGDGEENESGSASGSGKMVSESAMQSEIASVPDAEGSASANENGTPCELLLVQSPPPRWLALTICGQSHSWFQDLGCRRNQSRTHTLSVPAAPRVVVVAFLPLFLGSVAVRVAVEVRQTGGLLLKEAPDSWHLPSRTEVSLPRQPFLRVCLCAPCVLSCDRRALCSVAVEDETGCRGQDDRQGGRNHERRRRRMDTNTQAQASVYSVRCIDVVFGAAPVSRTAAAGLLLQ